MPAHVCPNICRTESCILCFESFGTLMSKGIFPATLLYNGSLSCHHKFCMRCARKWLKKAEVKDESPFASCPICRRAYDNLTEFPPHLIIASETPRRIEIPFPSRCQCPVGSKHWISPLKVHFTHQRISFSFKKGEAAFGWRRPSILDTMRHLMLGEEPPELDCLDVVWHQGRIFVAGSGNRRLCMWRLLAIFQPERWGMMRVRFVNMTDRHVRFEQAYDTECQGNYVEVRWGFKVGKSKDGDVLGEDPGVVWPQARQLFETLMPRDGLYVASSSFSSVS
eukprot:gb/GFBE01003543.1/.p1 GENE.gb/GFBE01003543.1/~~gb/GFBE01003543.1/.p1  ORF type:complete len:280 (+),score=24.00 gb/GFBE01003543.1/:1-840(+)